LEKKKTTQIPNSFCNCVTTGFRAFVTIRRISTERVRVHHIPSWKLPNRRYTITLFNLVVPTCSGF